MTQSNCAEAPLLTAFVHLTTRSALDLYVRPVNSEDADQLRDFLGGLTQEDLRFRFLSPVSKPGETLLETLLSVDHVKTEDYLAFADVDGRKALVASAMLAADAAMDRAEVAIATLPAFKQRGVGWTLLDFVAREAAARGIKMLESIECDDNRTAIELEKEMGFTAKAYPGDATLTLVCKTLERRREAVE